MDNAMHYESDTMTIGKHEWRITVEDGRFGCRVTEYQWRRVGSTFWRRSREWPGYDINNGMTLGMPATLRKLYEREKAIIAHVLDAA